MDLNALEGLCSALKKNRLVKELLLAQNSFGPHAIGHLSSLLTENKCLTIIDLRENGFGAGFVASLVAGLVDRFDTEPLSDSSAKSANFMGLVLICIDAKFCK